ncbi:MAG: DNA-binding protein [Treponema sp.]
MTTNEVAKKADCSTITARKWALENGVSYAGSDRAKIYLWSQEDYERFIARPKREKQKK